jgi:hypothetical protein
MSAYYRPIDCTAVSNIALSFSGSSSRTVYDGNSDAVITLLASDLTFSSCGALVLDVSYSPATTTAGIITIGSPSVSSSTSTVLVTMKNSQNIADEGVYTITFNAKFSG